MSKTCCAFPNGCLVCNPHYITTTVGTTAISPWVYPTTVPWTVTSGTTTITMSTGVSDFISEWQRAQATTMAKSDISIPKVLPDPALAVTKVHKYLHTKRKDLAGLSLMELFAHCKGVDPTRTWVVGSTVWRPAVLGLEPQTSADVDIVFADAGMAAEFIGTAHRRLGDAAGDPYRYSAQPNNMGGFGLSLAMKTNKLLDAWELRHEGDKLAQSIAEHIAGYPRDHERCALLVGCAEGEIGALTRLVKPEPTASEKEARSRRVSYGS